MRRNKMKKLIFILCVIVVIMVGCGQVPVEPVVDELQEESEPISGFNENEDDPIPDNSIQCISKYEEERFLNLNQLYFHDGWIFDAKSGIIRKYKPDLEEEAIVFSSDSGFSKFILNQDGFGLMLYSSNYLDIDDNDKIYILDVHTGEAEEIEIDFSPIYVILYKSDIIAWQQHGPVPPQLDMYDRNGNFVKTIVPEVLENYAFIDNSVYYRPAFSDAEWTIPGNTVMRYDLVSGITEKVLEFDLATMPWGDYCWPRVYFNGRTIIVNNLGSMFYTSIDKIEPIEIDFNLIKGRDDFFEFV